MAWVDDVSATLTHTTETTEKAVQASGGGDLKVEIAPTEKAQLLITCDNTDPTPADSMIVRIWTSPLDTPGAVPDSTQAPAGSDWGLYTAFRIAAAEENEPRAITIPPGHRHFAVSMEPTAANDSWSSVVEWAIATP